MARAPIALFEQFCLPSVMAQSAQGFRWIILFDAAMPERFRARIDAFANWRNILPVFIESPRNDIARYACDTITSLLAPQIRFVATTRLDNDDAIRADFVETVQRNLRPRREALNFPFGYVWHDGHIFLDEDRSNPFITLVEPIDAFGTVWQAKHRDIARVAPVRQLGRRPAWLQVVHGRNVSNRVRGVRVPAKTFDFEAFHVTLHEPLPDASLCALCFDHLRKPVWYFRFLRNRIGDCIRWQLGR